MLVVMPMQKAVSNYTTQEERVLMDKTFLAAICSCCNEVIKRKVAEWFILKKHMPVANLFENASGLFSNIFWNANHN